MPLDVPKGLILLHNITHMMRSVHGPSSRFETRNSGCHNPTASGRL